MSPVFCGPGLPWRGARGRADDFAQQMIHLLLPNRCMFCGKPVAYNLLRCSACEREVKYLAPDICPLCGQEYSRCVCRFAFERVIAPFYYELGPKKAVLDLKFYNNLLNARKLAVDMAVQFLASDLAEKVDAVVPVPMYPADQRRRGYNQALELAKWLALLLHLDFFPDGLDKCRRTAKQHELRTARERAANLTGAFRSRLPKTLRGGTVLLVDDVITTGNTVQSCSLALRKSGIERIVCICAAHARRLESGAPQPPSLL